MSLSYRYWVNCNEGAISREWQDVRYFCDLAIGKYVKIYLFFIWILVSSTWNWNPNLHQKGSLLHICQKMQAYWGGIHTRHFNHTNIYIYNFFCSSFIWIDRAPLKKSSDYFPRNTCMIVQKNLTRCA